MMNLLVFRERLRSFYQKYDIYICPIAKFLMSFYIFYLINTSIGYDDRLKKILVTLAASALCAFAPSAILVLISAILTIGHIYYVSPILAVIIILIIAIMYSLFLRFTPKLGYVIVAIPVLFVIKIPYLVPIALGLFFTPLSIIPTSCGVIVYYLLQVIKEAMVMDVTLSLEDTLQLYTFVLNGLMKNRQMYLTIVIFALIIMVTYFIRRMKFDYAREIAVAAGSLVCILGFLICDIKLDISEQIGVMILGTILSAILALVVQFFYMTLSYTGAEHVQFEDDDYYYYVKAVPKINVTEPKIDVKRFNTQSNIVLKEDEYDDLSGHIDLEEFEED